MLNTKYILKPAEDTEEIRVSIMSRHTLNDGITPHPEINSEKYHIWMKQLAPSEKSVGAYYRKELSWDEFEIKYFEKIRKPEIADVVRELAKESLELPVTLLCIEENPQYCHRRLLAEECKKYQPNLIINID